MSLFKAAPFWLGDGASDGGVEIDEGVSKGVAAGDSEEAGGGDGGELTAVGEGEAPLSTGAGGDAAGELADGETDGDGD